MKNIIKAGILAITLYSPMAFDLSIDVPITERAEEIQEIFKDQLRSIELEIIYKQYNPYSIPFGCHELSNTKRIYLLLHESNKDEYEDLRDRLVYEKQCSRISTKSTVIYVESSKLTKWKNAYVHAHLVRLGTNSGEIMYTILLTKSDVIEL